MNKFRSFKLIIIIRLIGSFILVQLTPFHFQLTYIDLLANDEDRPSPPLIMTAIPPLTLMLMGS